MNSTFSQKMLATAFAGGLAFLGATQANATLVPLGDASFEDFVVPGVGYAYADTYRPTSAWEDYLGPDDAASNWLYDNSYDIGRRPAPRTGTQAMHGYSHYSSQVTTEVFEANTTYTFSVWAQGDDDATLSSSRVWMYIYDATAEPGPADATALAVARYAPDTGDFINYDPGWTPQQSKDLGWTQISIQYTTGATGAELGNAVGVGFWGAGDSAVDDATFDVTLVPEPASLALIGLGGLIALKRRR